MTKVQKKLHTSTAVKVKSQTQSRTSSAVNPLPRVCSGNKVHIIDSDTNISEDVIEDMRHQNPDDTSNDGALRLVSYAMTWQ